MKPFASIPSQIPRSGIREIMDLARTIPDVIHLEVGQPDFDTPAHIVEATCEAARQGHTRYVPNAGEADLRAAAARYIQQKAGVPTEAGNILVTQGAVLSVATAFLALLEPGEEVLLPDPGWPNYSMAVPLFHGVSKYYELRPERQFRPDLAQLESLITYRTKILLLCSPSNPTGQVLGAGMVRDLMDLARKHDLWVVSDEIYSEIIFDGEHVSAAAHDPDERVILITGMSKSYAMTGYRVGFTRGSLDYIALASKIQEPLVSCGVGFAQVASVAALEGPQDCVAQMREAYRQRRDAALEVLRAHDLYRYSPGGAFYLLVDISSTGMPSHDFAIKLIEQKKVAVAPGSTFGQVCADHVRISIASPVDMVRDGLTRICELVRELSAA